MTGGTTGGRDTYAIRRTALVRPFSQQGFYSDQVLLILFFFKQKTAYEIVVSVWSSDVCSSDLLLTQQEIQAGVDLVNSENTQHTLLLSPLLLSL